MTTKAEDVFPVKRVRFEMDVPLDESMAEHRGMRAAQLMGTIEAVRAEIKKMEDDAKAAVKVKSKRLAEIESEHSELARGIREGTGKAWVDAEERANFRTNEVDTVVLEGPMYGVVASTRPMSPEERQLAIDIDAELPPRDPSKQVKVSRKPKADADTATH